MFNDMLINTVDLYAFPATTAPGGAVTKTKTLVTAAIPCNVQTISGQRIVAQGREDQILSHRVYFATNPGVKQGMLIRFGGSDLYVDAAYDPSAGHEAVWCADCVER